MIAASLQAVRGGVSKAMKSYSFFANVTVTDATNPDKIKYTVDGYSMTQNEITAGEVTNFEGYDNVAIDLGKSKTAVLKTDGIEPFKETVNLSQLQGAVAGWLVNDGVYGGTYDSVQALFADGSAEGQEAQLAFLTDFQFDVV